MQWNEEATINYGISEQLKWAQHIPKLMPMIILTIWGTVQYSTIWGTGYPTVFDDRTRLYSPFPHITVMSLMFCLWAEMPNFGKVTKVGIIVSMPTW